ncbi:MAG: chlorite dismutase family protein [Nitrospiraceae bacterium]
MRHVQLVAVLLWAVSLSAEPVGAEIDRDKLLKEAGVYATFAVFKASDQWWQMAHEARAKAVSEVKSVFEKYADKLTADTHLLRGLSERADVLVRIHSKDMINNQNFLVDLMSTALGKHLSNTDTFNGITKALNYVPSFPDDLKTELKTPPPQGSPYMIVVPIRKDAEWWMSGQDTRTGMMKEHTDATVAYLKTVKRKLYHSSGLDDWDFITYFETSKLDDFNNLVIGLLQVKENRHNQRFGDPLLLGTIRPLDEILEILAR